MTLNTHLNAKLKVIKFELREAVAVIEMANPPVNALTPDFLDDFETIFDYLENDQSARALLLKSACPGFFSAGDDLTKIKDLNPDALEDLPRVHRTLNRLEQLPIPSIAAINGHALGGGLELALACDFRFMATESGFIGLPEVRIGMIPAFGGTQRLPLLIGRAKALEIMYKGLQLQPEQALDIDLVTQVFPTAELEQQTFDYARRLARQATAAIGRIKRCVLEGQYHGFERGLALEQKLCREGFLGEDAKIGITAFLNSSKPQFNGRS